MQISLDDLYNDIWGRSTFAKRLRSAVQMLTEIENAGYEAYIAGGFVRDLVRFDLEKGYDTWRSDMEAHFRIHMGNYPTSTIAKLIAMHDYLKEGDGGFNDIDIATNMPVELLEKEYDCKSNHGEAHGTILVIRDGFAFEVTQFRVDGEYTDGRHPDSVTWASSFSDDTARRDFTVNALGMNADGEIVDYHHGIADLQNHVIRCVGDPEQRFNEDALRMLRAIRFAAKFEFEIDQATKDAIIKCAPGIAKVAMERVWNEIDKILKTCDVKKIRRFLKLVEYTGLAKHFDPKGYVNWSAASSLIKRYVNINGSTDIPKTVSACLLFLPSGVGLTGKFAKNGLLAAMRHYRTTADVMDRVVWYSTMTTRLGELEFDLSYFDNRRRYPEETEGRRLIDILDILEHRFGISFLRIYPALVSDYEHDFDQAVAIVQSIRDRIPTKAEVVQSLQRVGVGQHKFRTVLNQAYEKICRDAIGVPYLEDWQIDKLVATLK